MGIIFLALCLVGPTVSLSESSDADLESRSVIAKRNYDGYYSDYSGYYSDYSGYYSDNDGNYSDNDGNYSDNEDNDDDDDVTPEICEDKIQSCDSARHCRYDALADKFCRKTCKRCPNDEDNGSDENNGSDDDICKDKDNFNCKSYYCKYSESIATTVCRKTCNRCTDDNNEDENDSDSEDNTPEPVCQDRPAFPCVSTDFFCKKNLQISKKYCAKTCGFCQDGNSNDEDDHEDGEENKEEEEKEEEEEEKEEEDDKTPQPVCKDDYALCKNSLCSNRNVAEKYCRKTCNICQDNSDESEGGDGEEEEEAEKEEEEAEEEGEEQEPQPVCEDTYPSCGEAHCRILDRKAAERSCRKTCNFCQGDNEDEVPQSVCEDTYASCSEVHCRVLDRKSAERSCRKTCNLC